MKYTALKVRLIPTKEQQRLLWMHAGMRRYAYNFAKNYSENYYNKYNKTISTYDIRKVFISQYKQIPWIKDICKDVPCEAILDYGKARKKSFKDFNDGFHTSFKSKHDLYQGFAIDSRKIKIDGKIYLPKIGWISVNKTPKRRKYKNPRVVFDGQYWYLSLILEIPKTDVKLTDEVIGIDLGLKSLAVVSNGDIYENINRTKKVKDLETKKKSFQREMSRRYKKGSKVQSNNYMKSKRNHLRVCRKLKNIRQNHLHQVSTAIVKTKPKAIVLEDLKVSKLMKNKYLAKPISEACWYTMREYITYKAERCGIEVIFADEWFPSSRLCSNCHEKFNEVEQGRTWGLDIREWTCTCCKCKHDRDLNAAYNLKWYYNNQV